jgi:hypothetical protein
MEQRGHFFAAAAEAMRRILVNRARDKRRLKRAVDVRESNSPRPTSPVVRTSSTSWLSTKPSPAKEPAWAELVKLRFVAGLTQEDSARALGVPRWRAGRGALMRRDDPGTGARQGHPRC